MLNDFTGADQVYIACGYKNRSHWCASPNYFTKLYQSSVICMMRNLPSMRCFIIILE